MPGKKSTKKSTKKKKKTQTRVQKWETRHHQMATLRYLMIIVLTLMGVFFFLSIREQIVSLLDSWTVPAENNNETITTLIQIGLNTT